MNRVNDRRFPNSVCEVVLQSQMKKSWKTGLPVPIKNKCQFSWYCDGKADEPTNTDSVAWKVADNIAYQVLAFDKWNGIVEGATHYHADYVKPNWSNTLRLVTKIDDHIFYRRN